MNKLKEIKEYLLNLEGEDSTINKLIDEICKETYCLVHHKYSKDELEVSFKDCSVVDSLGGFDEYDELCDLDYFLEEYTKTFIEIICNAIDSFDNEEKISFDKLFEWFD